MQAHSHASMLVHTSAQTRVVSVCSSHTTGCSASIQEVTIITRPACGEGGAWITSGTTNRHARVPGFLKSLADQCCRCDGAHLLTVALFVTCIANLGASVA